MNWPLYVYELTPFFLWTDLFLSVNWPRSFYEVTAFCQWSDIFPSINWPNQHSSLRYLLVPVVGLDKRRVVEALADKPGFLGKLKPNISNKQWNMHTYTNIDILFSVMYLLIRPSDIFISAAHCRHKNTWQQIMCLWKQQWYIIDSVNCCWYHKNTWEQNMYK